MTALANDSFSDAKQRAILKINDQISDFQSQNSGGQTSDAQAFC